jgi:hypothetical protein
MENSGVAVAKVVARVASVGVDESSNAFLHDCFKQFGIHVMPVKGEAPAVLGRQKFEGCVLRLYAPDAEKVLRSARNSSSNRRMVIYGIARNTPESLRFSSFGINAIFDEPLERQGVLRVVRSTHLLVIHELRRYVRIPVVTEAVIEAGSGEKLVAATVEVSAGGMSVHSAKPVPSDEMARISFALPGEKQVKVRASMCWARPSENLYGFRFDTSDAARLAVRRWIDQYLELV